MIVINSVSIYPNLVSVGQTFKIAVRVSDMSWDNLKNTYSSWEVIAGRYQTWQALMEDNSNQTSWGEVQTHNNWEAVKLAYYDWFNIKDNIR